MMKWLLLLVSYLAVATCASVATTTATNVDEYFLQWSRSYWSDSDKSNEHQDHLSMLLEAPESGPSGSGRGIVMVAGGHILRSAAISVKRLRTLGCKLPIEIFHLPQETIAVEQKAFLFALDAKVMPLKDGNLPLSRMQSNVGPRHFHLKPLAVLQSSFEEVLLLDADNAPLRDPTVLFDSDLYLSNGAMFWPDYWKTSPMNPVWKASGLLPSDGWEQESGQVMIHKGKSVQPLKVLTYFNTEYFSHLLNGDKDTYRFSWMFANRTVPMVPHWPTMVGTPSGTDFCGLAMLQFAPDGKPMFLHHNGMKELALPAGENFPLLKAGSYHGGFSVRNLPAHQFEDRFGDYFKMDCKDLLKTTQSTNITTKVEPTDSGLQGFEEEYLEEAREVDSLLGGTFEEKRSSRVRRSLSEVIISTTMVEVDNEIADLGSINDPVKSSKTAISCEDCGIGTQESLNGIAFSASNFSVAESNENDGTSLLFTQGLPFSLIFRQMKISSTDVFGKTSSLSRIHVYIAADSPVLMKVVVDTPGRKAMNSDTVQIGPTSVGGETQQYMHTFEAADFKPKIKIQKGLPTKIVIKGKFLKQATVTRVVLLYKTNPCKKSKCKNKAICQALNVNENQCLCLPGTSGKNCRDGNPKWSSNKKGSEFIYVQDPPLSWLEAQSICLRAGGNLASLHSTAEKNFLKRLITSNREPVEGEDEDEALTWIGMFQNLASYAWSDRSLAAYAKWFPGFPNSKMGKCVAQLNEQFGRWRTEKCGKRHPYACVRAETDP